MSEELLNKILVRNNIDEDKKSAILSYYYSRKQSFMNNVDTTIIKELCSFSIKEFSDNNIAIDIPSIVLEKKIYYNKEEFEEHRACVFETLSCHKNYSLCLINNIPIKDIQIFNKREDITIISFANNPTVVYAVNNPNLNNALCLYLEELADKSITINNENISNIENLIY